jgi:hypothetical protein
MDSKSQLLCKPRQVSSAYQFVATAASAALLFTFRLSPWKESSTFMLVKRTVQRLFHDVKHCGDYSKALLDSHPVGRPSTWNVGWFSIHKWHVPGTLSNPYIFYMWLTELKQMISVISYKDTIFYIIPKVPWEKIQFLSDDPSCV